MAGRVTASLSIRTATAALGLAALHVSPWHQRRGVHPFQGQVIACEALALRPSISPSLVPTRTLSNSKELLARGSQPSAAVLKDEYEVVSRIGRGSYGEVFSARHRQTGALRAIKSGSSRDIRVAKSFPREVQALATLDHPHIVGLVDFLTEGENLYIVEELCAGPDLLDYLSSSPLSREGVPYIPETAASAILRQCLKAIIGCHSRGLAHRDVKLDNFVIADDGTVKLIDFGLASSLAFGCETQAVGTADYLAPEAASKSTPSAAADVWSLGIVLFVLLTGESFLPGDVTCIAQARRYLEDPRFIQERLSSTPAALAISEQALDLLQSLLRYDPSERIAASDALLHPFITSVGKA